MVTHTDERRILPTPYFFMKILFFPYIWFWVTWLCPITPSVLLERGNLFAYIKHIPVGLNESTNGPIASWKRYLNSKYIVRATQAIFSAKRTNVTAVLYMTFRLNGVLSVVDPLRFISQQFKYVIWGWVVVTSFWEET